MKKNKLYKALQSKIRMLVIVFIVLFLVQFASAELFQFDNVKSYDVETKIMTITNTFGIGKEIAKIQLKTPMEVVVPVGYQKVAEFQLTNYEDYLNVFEKMEFYNIKEDMKVIERQFDYKVLRNLSYEVNDYEEIKGCIEKDYHNCYKIIGTHLDYYEDWISLEKVDFVKGEILTIGIFTQVNMYDNVEWILTAYGKELTEWASYVQSSGTKTYQDIGGVNYTTETFTSNGYFNSTKDNLETDILVIGGGGAGGTDQGGGGGGGGILYNTDYNISAGNYVVIVGAGATHVTTAFQSSGNGSNSSFNNLVAWGGGGSINQEGNGLAGGSGGGGSGGGSTAYVGGLALQGSVGGTGYGNNGGNIVLGDTAGSGGGGGGGVGGNSDTGGGGDGGAGRSFTIYNGTSLCYTGGGGGGSANKGDSSATCGGGIGKTGSGSEIAGGNGVNGTGGGGGGGSGWGGNGGDGGSGIVIIIYKTADAEIQLPALSVTLNSPINYFNTTTATVMFNATAIDYNLGGGIKNVSLYIDGSLSTTNTSGVNGTYIFTKILNSGTHNWSILAFNQNNSANQSETRIINLTILSPTITLNSPENYFNTSSLTPITFNATVTDNLFVQNVSLYIDEILNQTNTSNFNGTYIFTNSFAEGLHNWSILAYDNDSNPSQSANRYFTLDTTPFIEFITPPTLVNYANITQEYIPMKVNVSTLYFKNISFYLENENGTSYTQFFTNETYDINFTNIPDGHYHYNVTVCTTTDRCNITEMRHINHDTIPPTINIVSPLNTTTLTTFAKVNNNTVSFDWTVQHSPGDADKCWFSTDNGVTNTTITCNNNRTLYFPFGQHTIIGWANDTLGNLNVSRRTFTLDYKIFENSITYKNATNGGVPETYNYTFNKSSTLTISSISFLYNNVSSPVTYNSLNFQKVTANYITPNDLETYSIPDVANYSFYWSFLMSDGTRINSTYKTQNVSVVNFIADCSAPTPTEFLAGNWTVMEFTMIDEETLGEINGTIEVLMNLYSLGTTDLLLTYNASFTYDTNGLKPRVCLSNITNNYSMSYQIKHFNSTSYFTKYRNIQYATLDLNAVPMNITLYNLLRANGNTFTLRVSGNTYADNGDLLIEVQKQYIPNNTFEVVESPITSQSGEAIAHLIPSSSIYNFIISKNGIIIGMFNNFQVQCVNSICSIPLNLNVATVDLSEWTNYGGISGVFSTNNVTKVITFDFASTDGTPHNVTLKLLNANQTSIICQDSVISAYSSVSCLVPTTYQNISFWAETYSDGKYLGNKIFSFFAGISSADYYGVDILIEILMYTTLVMLFISNAVLIVIGAILGMFFAITLILINTGAWYTSVGLIVYFIVAGIAVIWQINRMRN